MTVYFRFISLSYLFRYGKGMYELGMENGRIFELCDISIIALRGNDGNRTFRTQIMSLASVMRPWRHVLNTKDPYIRERLWVYEIFLGRRKAKLLLVFMLKVDDIMSLWR